MTYVCVYININIYIFYPEEFSVVFLTWRLCDSGVVPILAHSVPFMNPKNIS